MNEDRKIAILHMAANLKTCKDEKRSVTDIYNEMIACIEEVKKDD